MMRFSKSQTIVTGVYRSGTEYLSQLLSGHPQLSVTMYHVNALRFIMGQYDPLDRPENLERALADLNLRLGKRYGLSVGAARIRSRLETAGQTNWGHLYDAVMSELWLRGDASHWAEKCQLVWREIPRFLETMPNGRAILLLRDPRSVTASFQRFTYAPPPAYLGAVFNSLDALQHATQYQRTLDPARFAVVRYEDLARHPQQERDRLFRFMNLDPSEARHDPSRWINSAGEKWSNNTSFGNGEQFDVEASINRWQQNIDPIDRGLAEAVCGDEMRNWGYDDFGFAPDWPAILRRILPDHAMTAALRLALVDGKGLQAFPADPADPANWASATGLREA